MDNNFIFATNIQLSYVLWKLITKKSFKHHSRCIFETANKIELEK